MARTPEYRKARHALTERLRYARKVKGLVLKPLDINKLSIKQMQALTGEKIEQRLAVAKKVGPYEVEVPIKDWKTYEQAKAKEAAQAKKYGFDFSPIGNEYFRDLAGFKKLLEGTVKRGRERYSKKMLNTWYKNSLQAWAPYRTSTDWRTRYLYKLYREADPSELFKRIRKLIKENPGMGFFDELFYQKFLGKPDVHNKLRENAILLIPNKNRLQKFLDPSTTETEWKKLVGA